jgi:hypothetical protein
MKAKTANQRSDGRFGAAAPLVGAGCARPGAGPSGLGKIGGAVFIDAMVFLLHPKAAAKRFK